MKKVILAALLLLVVPTWGQFLTSSQHSVEPFDSPGDSWKFPDGLVPLVGLPIPDLKIYKGDPNEALTVMQGEYAVLSESDPRFQLLSSNGAVPCTMVVLKTVDNKAVAHSHFDALTTTSDSLAQMVEQMQRFSSAPIEATLAGAASDQTLLSKIVADLGRLGIVQIRFFRSGSLAVDKSGQFYFNSVYSDNLIPLPERRDRLKDELGSISDKISQLTQQAGCDYQCMASQIKRPLRKLYVSE